MKTVLKRVASLLMALIMILEVVAPGVVEARSGNNNRATVSDEAYIPPDGNRIDPDQNHDNRLPEFIDPDDDGYYYTPRKTPARPAQNAPAQAAPKQGNEAGDVEVSEEKAPKPLIEDEAESKEMALEFSREKELARAKSPQEGGIENKKFTILTRWDISNANGAVQAGQYFTIKLDDKLMVKDEKKLPRLSYPGYDTITEPPKYNKSQNTITYKLSKTIDANISVPIQVDVDYNTKNINPDDQEFTVVNSVYGMGVVTPKKLLPVVVDANGNMVSTIIEPGRKDVVQIFDYGKNYKVNVDAFGDPVIENGEMKSIRWRIEVTSDTDLKELGFKANFTAVKGSGLGKFDKIQLNNQTVTLADNDIHNMFGIVDSKHHVLEEKANKLYYSFETSVTNKQSAYMLDLSAILTKPNKLGAVRLVLPQGYSQAAIREATPTRVGMNNRTTIMGEFKDATHATWTITDAVCTGDAGNLPLETRDLGDNQTPVERKTATYKLDPTTGKMVVSKGEQTINAFPDKETDTGNSTGTIAVYEMTTNLTDADQGAKYSVSGVTISQAQDLYVYQEWGMPAGRNMPAQQLKVVDGEGHEQGPYTIGAGKDQKTARRITIPNVKYWTINDDGTATFKGLKIKQSFPQPTPEHGKTYEYREIQNYYRTDIKDYFIHNDVTEKTEDIPVTFSVLKVDKDKVNKPLAGAKYTLLNSDTNKTLVATTGKDGKVTFGNVPSGTYKLVENKAPAGYKLDTEEKIVTVRDGKVSVTGNNATLAGGDSKPVVNEHDKYPNWPDYMNTMHFGKIDKSGNITFYLYLKPRASQYGKFTDKDTRLDLRIDGVPDTRDMTVEVFDVNPTNRNAVRGGMEERNETAMLQGVGDPVLNKGRNNVITGTDNETDQYTGNKGYKIFFPQARFEKDWGFMVKVTAKVDKNTKATKLYYDWLTNKDTAGQTNLQKEVILTKSDEGKDTLITVTDESAKKQTITLTKIDEGKGDQQKVLPGAAFVIKDPEGNVVAEAMSGGDGNVTFPKIPTGQYVIEEKRAPKGYLTSNVVFDVEVKEDGQITYKARFKDSNGVPAPGYDYIITNEEAQNPDQQCSVTTVKQRMKVKEDGSIGIRPGVWEAFMYESLDYDADFTIKNAAPGKRFVIQFDPNLDFTQYVKEFPKITLGGKEIADPYFDYATNRLTYVFNKNSGTGDTSGSIHITGIIPSKYWAKTDGSYKVKTIFAPGQTGAMTQDSNPNYDFTFEADYGRYDTGTGSPVSQSYYFGDIYKKGEDTYVSVIAYYNPLGNYSGPGHQLKFNWMSTSYPGGSTQIARWPGNGNTPAFDLTEVKVYRTEPKLDWSHKGENNEKRINWNMPPSFGVELAQDPYTYQEVFRQEIDPRYSTGSSSGGVSLTYDKGQIQRTGTVNQNAPLSIKMPTISQQKEGYVIQQTFKINDLTKWKELWRVFYMSNGKLESAFANKVRGGEAVADQTNQEVPKCLEQRAKLINRKYIPGNFSIKKVNRIDRTKTLAGAVFELTGTGENADVIRRVSGEDGILSFNDLAPGSYSLAEIKAPAGYHAADKFWQISVQVDGQVTIVERGAEGSGQTLIGNNIQIEVGNTPVGTGFKVYKKDENGRPLTNVQFKMTGPKKGSDDNGPTTTVVSDGNGIINFNQLIDGDYILEEAAAPEGYQKLDKKWLVRVKDGKVKVYGYVPGTLQANNIDTLVKGTDTRWVDVGKRDVTEFSGINDQRWSGYTGGWQKPYRLGTRIIAINRTDKYVIQRYVLNPEGRDLPDAKVEIHREKPDYTNMDWYNGGAFSGEAVKAYTLNKAVTDNVEDIRLAQYGAQEVNPTKSVATKTGEPQRMKLEFGRITTPIVIDVKIPYKDENGGVGTGADYTLGNGESYWKSDYYQRVATIVDGELVESTNTDVNKGPFISDDTLTVTNERKEFTFKLRKVKEGNKEVIEGATFTLLGPHKESVADIERTITTGRNGEIAFDELEAGEYTLKETTPAPGYEKADTDWTVTVKNDGVVNVKANKAGAEGGNRSVYSADEFTPVARRISALNHLALLDETFGNEAGMSAYRSAATADEAAGKQKAAQKPIAEAEEKKDAPAAGKIAANEAEDTAIATGGMSRVAVLDHFLTTFGVNSGLELGEENVPMPVGAESDWETIDPNRSEGFSQGSVMAKENGAPVVTKMMEINKVDNQLKQSFIFSPSPFGDRKREIQIHRQPEYDLNKADIVQVSFYKVSGNTFETMGQKVPQNIRYDVNRKNGNGPNRIYATIPSGITGPILVEVTVKYDQNNGVGLGTNYNSNTAASQNNKSWLAHSYQSEAGINCKHLITIGSVTNGTVSAPSSAKQGEMVTLTPTPASADYIFDHYTVTKKSGGEIQVINNQFEMPNEDVTVMATFKKKAYKVTINGTRNGSVVASPTEADEGQKVTLTVTPDNGYEKDALFVYNTAAGSFVTIDPADNSFIMPASDVVVTATFKEKKSYTVTVENTQHGTASTAPTPPVVGQPVTVNATPDEGYMVDAVTVTGPNGTIAYNEDNNTFIMPASNVTVKVTFKVKPPKTFNILTEADPAEGGTVSVSAATAAKDATITVTARAYEGYTLKAVTVNNGAVQFNTADNTFKMPASDVKVKATFTKTGGADPGTDPMPEQPNPDPNNPNNPDPKDGTYEVIATQPVGGTVWASRSRANDKNLVVVKATPKAGYQFKRFIIKDDNGDIPILAKKPASQGQGVPVAAMAMTPVGGAANTETAYFYMRQSDANVTAEFEPISDPGVDIQPGDFAEITNKLVGLDLKLFKRGFHGESVGGAEFTLKQTDATYNTVIKDLGKAISREQDGAVVFVDSATNKLIRLPVGYYKLEETRSPAGYKRVTAPWLIQVLEENGRLVAKYNGPEDTPYTFIRDHGEVSKLADAGNGIKYASRVTAIDPEGKTFVQRIYVDTRAYTGQGKVNVQINPVNKREEIDTPGKPPKTTTEGVKTAYRTTYEMTNIKDLDLTSVNSEDIKDILSKYDLSKPGVSMVNTARWRPFDWGFDEDQLNLDKGVYFIDVEGYYDDKIITEHNADIALNVDFYTERYFWQWGVKEDGTKGWISEKGASYQKGNIQWGATDKTDMGKATTPGNKYPNWLSKSFVYNGYRYAGGQIYPALEGDSPVAHATTTINLSPLYSANDAKRIPQDGLILENEDQGYNITFSKHGLDKPNWKVDGKEVTNNRLEGAVFKIQKLVGSTFEDVQGSYVASAFNGYFGFRNLKLGTYRLMEVQAPKGYAPINDPILYFTISDTKEPIKDKTTGKIIEGGGWITLEYDGGNNIYEYIGPDGKRKEGEEPLIDFVTSGTARNMGKIVNTKPGKGEVTLHKVDEGGQALGSVLVDVPGKGKLPVGAKFRLTRLSATLDPNATEGEQSKNNISQEKTVDDKGNLVFDNLIIGNYKLEEVSSPPGYINKGQEWYFTVGGKGLDPYADETPAENNDLTDKITMTSKMNVVRPQNGDTVPESKAIKPHYGESFEFINRFEVAPGTDIKPGDFFVVKLTDNIDLNGIHTNQLRELDIFADGVGTIAKAKYDADKGEIKYIFTKYATQYKLEPFSNRLYAFVNLYKVKNSGNKTIGLGINSPSRNMITWPVYVNYTYVTGKSEPTWAYRETYWGGSYRDFYQQLNMASKIVKFNQETGEFEQYFYINRDRKLIMDSTFRYTPNLPVKNLKMTPYRLKDNYYRLEDDMPKSFGVTVPDAQYYDEYRTKTFTEHVTKAKPATMKLGRMDTWDSWIIKVTGKIDTENFESYSSDAKLFQLNSNYQEVPWAARHDEVYAFNNENSARATLTYKAINPSNKLVLKKTDPDGNPLEGVKFSLRKKLANGSFGGTQTEPTTDANGLATFEKLKPGEYQIFETDTIKGYIPRTEPVIEFTVSEKTGKIMRKVKDSSGNVLKDKDGNDLYEEVTGEVPFVVVNHKPIHFKKRDVDTKTVLPGAKFKLYYKPKEKGTYEECKEKNDNNEEVPLTRIADKDGKIELSLTKPGYYALEEIQAPKGYMRPMGYIKEFVLKDDHFNVKEQAFEGNVKKRLDSNDKDTSIMFAEKYETSVNGQPQVEEGTFKGYVVINPAHEMRTYDSSSLLTGTFGLSELSMKNYALYKIKKDGTKVPIPSGSLVRFDGKGRPTLDLYKALGGTTGDKTSDDTLVLEAIFNRNNPEQKDFNLVFEIKDKDETRRSSYRINLEDLKDENSKDYASITNPVLYYPIRPKAQPGEDKEAVDKKYEKILAEYLKKYGEKEVYLRMDNMDWPIDNRKAVYPFTGGFGPRWIVIIGAVIAAVAAEEYIRRKRTSAPKGGA